MHTNNRLSFLRLAFMIAAIGITCSTNAFCHHDTPPATSPQTSRHTPSSHTKEKKTNDVDPFSVFKTWHAGVSVPLSTVKAYGEDRCFTSSPISDEVFKRMEGKSFKKNGTLQRSSLCYLKVLHYNAYGAPQLGELVCHKSVSDDLLSIFRALYQAHYPIERMVLIDEYDADDTRSMEANNTTCFNYRQIKGRTKLSKHSQGLAVDINPLYNPHVKKDAHGKMIVNPPKAIPYANRSKAFRYRITKSDLCYKEFVKHGFRWGGAWRSSQDYQHFEK